MQIIIGLVSIISFSPLSLLIILVMCYVAILMVGEFGAEWIHVYVWVSPFTVHLKLSQYC